MWFIPCSLFSYQRGLKKEYKVLLLAHINCEVKVIFKKSTFCYLSFNLLTCKYQLRILFLVLLLGDRMATHLVWSSKPCEGRAIWRANAVPSCSEYWFNWTYNPHKGWGTHQSFKRGGSIYHVWQKRFPFCMPSFGKCYPFHIPSLELCIPFNCSK